MKRQRLFSARGFDAALTFTVATAIAAAAARPRNADNHIQRESPPIHERFPGNPIYQLQFFLSPEFLAFKAKVRAAEDDEMAMLESQSSFVGFDVRGGPLTPMSQRILEVLRPGQVLILHELQSLQAAVEKSTERRALFIASNSTGKNSGNDRSERTQEASEVRGANGRSRISRLEQVDPSAGHQFFVQMRSHRTAKELWTEYTTGINSGPSLRALEAQGPSWRNYGNARKRWSEQHFLYTFIEVQMTNGASEDDAVAALQGLLDAHPRKSALPNWTALMKQVSMLPEIQQFKKHRTKRHVVKGSAADEEINEPGIEFERDGTVLVNEGNGDAVMGPLVPIPVTYAYAL